MNEECLRLLNLSGNVDETVVHWMTYYNNTIPNDKNYNTKISLKQEEARALAFFVMMKEYMTHEPQPGR